VADHAYDIVLFGASGFTGALTAEYLAAHLPAGSRLALAGRDRARLESLRDRLGVDAGLIAADVADERSMRRMAEAGRVVATTVGPYIRHGEPLVAACAAAGTDYVDLTGEPEFLDLMYLRHHDTAVRTGARLVHACGIEAIPADLGALFTVEQLPEGEPIRIRGYLSARGRASDGTVDTLLTNAGRRRSAAAAHRERRRAEPADPARRIRGLAGRPGYARDVRAWVVPLPTIDHHIVLRSARADERYGPDFSYSHFGALRSPVRAAALGVGAAAVLTLSRFGPTRRALRRLLTSGSGPTAEQRARSWFRLRFLADCGDRRLVTQVSGADPGYGETAKMLAEAALCLAHDPLPAVAGQVTTALAMGGALRRRLEAAGIRFDTLHAG
jgi:saccharopine dehydrogenase (NAD+, L-glutamate forming)